MGGTTAKCAIVERGLVQTTDEYHVDGHPLRIPVIDIKEVSAGGGTIAWIDAGGALALGPQSAGADPGPGLLRARRRRAHRHRREPGARAHRRRPLPRRHHAARPRGGGARHRGAPRRCRSGLARDNAAAGVVRLADVKMALAVRSITTERGLDPRDYALVAYGGGGPLHAVAIARELGHPARHHPARRRRRSRRGACSPPISGTTWCAPCSSRSSAPTRRGPRRAIGEMQREIEAILPPVGAATHHRAADLRYLGQEHTVTVEVGSLGGLGVAPRPLRRRAPARLRLRGARRRGAAPEPAPHRRVPARAAARCPTLDRADGAWRRRSRRARSTPRCSRDVLEYRVFQRERLRAGDVVEGPAAIEEAGTTDDARAGRRPPGRGPTLPRDRRR